MADLPRSSEFRDDYSHHLRQINDGDLQRLDPLHWPQAIMADVRPVTSRFDYEALFNVALDREDRFRLPRLGPRQPAGLQALPRLSQHSVFGA